MRLFEARPAHLHVAYIGVEVEERSDADRQGHDFVELRPLGGVQVEHVEHKLPQLWAVAVRDRGEGTTHYLQNESREILHDTHGGNVILPDHIGYRYYIIHM